MILSVIEACYFTAHFRVIIWMAIASKLPLRRSATSIWTNERLSWYKKDSIANFAGDDIQLIQSTVFAPDALRRRQGQINDGKPKVWVWSMLPLGPAARAKPLKCCQQSVASEGAYGKHSKWVMAKAFPLMKEMSGCVLDCLLTVEIHPEAIIT